LCPWVQLIHKIKIFLFGVKLDVIFLKLIFMLISYLLRLAIACCCCLILVVFVFFKYFLNKSVYLFQMKWVLVKLYKPLHFSTLCTKKAIVRGRFW
jgi:hypothetical protein